MDINKDADVSASNIQKKIINKDDINKSTYAKKVDGMKEKNMFLLMIQKY